MSAALNPTASKTGSNIARHLAEMARLQASRPAVICASGRDAAGAVA